MQPINEATDRSRPTRTDSSIAGGPAYRADIARRVARDVVRSESRQRVMAYVRVLMREAERKNSWQVAEACGEPTSYGFQSLLARADWDADMVRDELRTYIIQHLGAPHGGLVLDETSFVRKGRQSAGVARQYSGTVGTVQNGQIGVFLGYASPLGHPLLDRERYLPKEWTDDRPRCEQAGIPADRPFATKPQLARQLLAHASRPACRPRG